MVNNKISKILIVDDHIIVKTGIEFSLRKINPAIETFHAGDFIEALVMLKRFDFFDLVILDINIPGGNNLGMIDTIRLKRPEIPILIFTAFNERDYAIPYMRAGVNGYLSKEASETDFEKAIICIGQGRKYISDDIQQIMVESMVTGKEKEVSSFNNLSKREMDVANLLIKGYSTAQIGQMLSLQLSTVSTFKSRVFFKMGVNNLVELISKMPQRV